MYTYSKWDAYQMSLKDSRDLNAALKTAFKEGNEAGIKEGIKKGEQEKALDIARNLLKQVLSVTVVAQATGLSEAVVESLAEDDNLR